MAHDMPGTFIPPGPTGLLFTFEELEGPNGAPGRKISFSDVHIVPCGYHELAKLKMHQPVTIQLEMLNGRIRDTDVADIDTSHYANIKTTLESQFTSRAIGLVRGGWLPSALAANHQRSTILVDRNVVAAMVSRFGTGAKAGLEPDFLDLFADAPVRVNPILYAIEGNTRAIPDAELVRSQLYEVATKLHRALPNAQLMIGPQTMDGLLAFINGTRAGMERKERFLLSLAPDLSAPTAVKHASALWNAVLDAADNCGVARDDFVVLAALSSVSIPGGLSVARRVLKFRAGYTGDDAYNALADLRSLELLADFIGRFPDEAIQLCTADKAMALFWCGMQVSDFLLGEEGVTYSISPVEELLPANLAEKWRIAVEAKSSDDR